MKMTSAEVMEEVREIRSGLEGLRRQIILSPTKEQFRKYKGRFNFIARRFNGILASLRGEFVIVDDSTWEYLKSRKDT